MPKTSLPGSQTARFVVTLSLALALAVAVVGSACSSSKSGPKEILRDEVRVRLTQETVRIIDTRDVEDFDARHINAGYSFSVVDMEYFLKDAPKDELIVVSGQDRPANPVTVRLAQSLIDRGFTNVAILDEGFAGWVANNFPTRTMAEIPMTARPPHARREPNSIP